VQLSSLGPGPQFYTAAPVCLHTNLLHVGSGMASWQGWPCSAHGFGTRIGILWRNLPRIPNAWP